MALRLVHNDCRDLQIVGNDSNGSSLVVALMSELPMLTKLIIFCPQSGALRCVALVMGNTLGLCAIRLNGLVPSSS